MTTGDLSRQVPDAHDAPSGVHHDLRHELATLRTLLTVAGDDASLDAAEVRRLVGVAQSEVGLAFDLLDALPIPSPRAPSPSETVAPRTAAVPRSEVAGILRAAATATAPRGRRVTVDATGPLYVAMHRTDLARVVRNLLGNALGATSPDGTVRLHARRDDVAPGSHARWGPTCSYIRVEIHDDGPGPGSRGFHRGGGLGLDVVRSLVLPAGGWLVLGTSPFGGACATVTLPAPAGAEA